MLQLVLKSSSHLLLSVMTWVFATWREIEVPTKFITAYRQSSNTTRTLVGNKIVDHSYVGAAPSAFPFSTEHLVLMDWAKTLGRGDEKHLYIGILAVWW